MRVDHREDELENHDRGLDYDLPRLLQRRGMLKLVLGAGLAGTGLVSLAACADDTTAPARHRLIRRRANRSRWSSGRREPRRRGGRTSADQRHGKRRTAGGDRRPLSGRWLQRANVLTQSGIVRSDITSSFGSSTTKAQGVPLAITMTIKDFAGGKKPLAAGAVYLWHCNREGQYSLYSQGVTSENYLRGVQETDANGTVRFARSSPPATRDAGHISLRGLPQPDQGHQRLQQDRHIADCVAGGPCKAVYATSGTSKRQQSEPGQPEQRQRIRRRLRPTAPRDRGRPQPWLPAHVRLCHVISSSAIDRDATGAAFHRSSLPNWPAAVDHPISVAIMAAKPLKSSVACSLGGQPAPRRRMHSHGSRGSGLVEDQPERSPDQIPTTMAAIASTSPRRREGPRGEDFTLLHARARRSPVGIDVDVGGFDRHPH